jgi:hypothetical protein
MHTSHARCYKASEWVGGSLQCRRGILVILWMSLVDVAVGAVRDGLGGGVVGLSLMTGQL